MMKRLKARDNQMCRVNYVNEEESEEESSDEEEQLVLSVDGRGTSHSTWKDKCVENGLRP